VWEKSGHLDNFSDPLVECEKCHQRFREDQLATKVCPACKGNLSPAKQFNLMLKTFLGPAEESANVAYLRPETAQGIFVNFKNIADTTRKKPPFGVGQIGKAFRNEITPGNFIFRTREFEQMEIEYFIPEPKKDKDWQTEFERWRLAILDWIKYLGVDIQKEIHEFNVPKEKLAHYSKKTIDFEYEFPFGRDELCGLAYRTDFDLKKHGLEYTDGEGNKYVPHVIEPSLGVDRSVLAALCSAYREEELDKETRIILRLPKYLAPIKIAVFPLLKNKEQLVARAKEVFNLLKKDFVCEFDDNGNVGKRYRRQDEIGTPYCVTIDFDTLDNETVTVRDRDTMEQERIKISDLLPYFHQNI
jgi:glycyl-tRNA synthetase